MGNWTKLLVSLETCHWRLPHSYEPKLLHFLSAEWSFLLLLPSMNVHMH